MPSERRIGLGAGWTTLVAAELVAAQRGLGFMVQSAAQYLFTDVVIMGIFVIAAVAFASRSPFAWLSVRLCLGRQALILVSNPILLESHRWPSQKTRSC